MVCCRLHIGSGLDLLLLGGQLGVGLGELLRVGVLSLIYLALWNLHVPELRSLFGRHLL